jgi:hypothetical protein
MGVTQLKHKACSLSYGGVGPKGGIVKKSFIKRWMRDAHRKTVERVIFEPRVTDNANVYNIFDGFVAAKLPLLPLAARDSLMEPILAFIHEILASGDAAYAEFCRKWIAHLLQNPMEMTGVALCFCDGDWEYQQMLFEFIAERVIGEQYTRQNADPKRHLLSKSADDHYQTLLVRVHAKYVADLEAVFI